MSPVVRKQPAADDDLQRMDPILGYREGPIGATIENASDHSTKHK